VIRVAATYPNEDPDRGDTGLDRPALSAAQAPRRGWSPWLLGAIAIAAIAVIAVVVYVLVYSGGSGAYGSGGGGGQGGGSGGGYFVVAFAGETMRRLVSRFRR
jgi:hypothetical protein